MKVLDLGDVAPLGRVGHRIGCDPLDIDFAGLGIRLDPAWNRVAEGVGEGKAVSGEDVDRWPKRLPTIVRGRDVDLADRKVVVADVNLVLICRSLAREYG